MMVVGSQRVSGWREQSCDRPSGGIYAAWPLCTRGFSRKDRQEEGRALAQRTRETARECVFLTLSQTGAGGRRV